MRSLIAACAGLAMLCEAVMAQTYVLRESVIGSTGGSMSGSTYGVTGTLAQPSPVGASAGATYQTYHGFWHGVGWAPLDAMVVAITLVSSSTARLSWDPVALATAYDLYRSTSAYFAASGSPWQTVTAPTVQYDFTDGIGNAALTFYFKGRARNAVQTSPESNAVGEFERSSTSSSIKPGGFTLFAGER